MQNKKQTLRAAAKAQAEKEKLNKLYDDAAHNLTESVMGSRFGKLFFTNTLLVCCLVGLVFHLLDQPDSIILMVFVSGVLLIAALTQHVAFWIAAPFCAIILFNCLYSDPRFTLFYFDSSLTIVLVMLLLVSLGLGSICRTIRAQMRSQLALEIRSRDQQTRVNLLRSLGHDLRTPLTGISGDAQLLLYKGERMDESSRRELYASILENSDWLANMVENILFVTRVSNGPLEMEKQPDILSDLVKEAMTHISRKGQQHIIDLEIKDDMLMVNADGRLLMQVVTNLVNNAIMHTQIGSRITVLVSGDAELARVEVLDDGPGISGGAEQAFEMFYSTANSDNSARRGMGLGLSICRTIIEAHDGELYYQDNHPHGSVFGFTLPRERMED